MKENSMGFHIPVRYRGEDSGVILCKESIEIHKRNEALYFSNALWCCLITNCFLLLEIRGNSLEWTECTLRIPQWLTEDAFLQLSIQPILVDFF